MDIKNFVLARGSISNKLLRHGIRVKTFEIWIIDTIFVKKYNLKKVVSYKTMHAVKSGM